MNNTGTLARFCQDTRSVDDFVAGSKARSVHRCVPQFLPRTASAACRSLAEEGYSGAAVLCRDTRCREESREDEEKGRGCLHGAYLPIVRQRTSLGYEENKHEPKSHKRGRIRFVSGELATMLEHIYSHQTTTVSSLLLKR